MLPANPPFNEIAWDVWVAKGRKHDARGSAARGKLVRWIPIAALALTVVLWSRGAPDEIAIRFIVAAGAIAVMFQSFVDRHYAVAALLAVLAPLYNPVVPVFSFSGVVWCAVAIASIVPFAASLAWKITKGKTRNIS
jgi:hypothetical protein